MNKSSPSVPTPLEDLQSQPSNLRNEEDSKTAEFSQSEKCESTQRRCYEGVSDQPIRRSLRFSEWNNEAGLLSALESKTIHQMFKHDYTSSHEESSFADRLSSDHQNVEVHTTSLQEGDAYALSASSPEQTSIIIRSNQAHSSIDVDTSTAVVVSRRELLPNILGHGGSIVSSSQPSPNFRIQSEPSLNLLYRRWLSRGLNDVIRSSWMFLGYTSNIGNRAPQVDQEYSVSENRSPSEVDLLRQYYEQALLFVQMLDSGSAEGSLALRITTAQNGRPHEQGILFLGQSPLLNIVDLHDGYEDMRLDVENMSYEELLDLEDRIGSVSTGLSDDIIDEVLEHKRYFLLSEENARKESCSICQDDYIEEEELGTLNCGHHFHRACIKQWLKCKNVCPVCKSTGLIILEPSIAANT